MAPAGGANHCNEVERLGYEHYNISIRLRSSSGVYLSTQEVKPKDREAYMQRAYLMQIAQD